VAPESYDLVVVGAGPGGYTAAIRAAQLGLSVASVESEPLLGGTCLRIGCIPSKALLESSELFLETRKNFSRHGIKVGSVSLDLPAMMRRKQDTVTALTKGVEGLFKKNKVARHTGHGRLAGPGRVAVERDGQATELAARHILVATGSVSAPLPGVELDGTRVLTSTEALALPEVPGHLVVIGAGAIGLELGSVWHRLGAKVTVLEYLDRIVPGLDAEIAAEALKIFKKQGLEFHLGARVTAARAEADGAIVEREGGEPLRCDRVLLAVGRVPFTDGLGLESVGLHTDARGRIEVNERFETGAPGVYAIGDVIRGPMLAHKAEDEGIACVEWIATGYGHVNYDAIPSIVYTMPEIASVGKSEEQLRADGVPFRAGLFPFMANGRARALGHTEGKVKILAHAETDRILGAHIIGPRAGDLVAELAVAIEFGATAEDIARSTHAHPTLAEVVREAALAVDGRALNI
jgi:dihydrolipoamide dehydrogenase